MAKKSSIEKNNRRKLMAIRQDPIRRILRKTAVNMNLTEEQRWEAQLKLQKLKKNGAPARVVNRCHLTGRPRGFVRRFGLSRIAFREQALDGKLPGVTKASW